MITRAAIIVFAMSILAGCAQGRFVGGTQCMPDGSPVFWQYKNTQGSYEGAKASKENCMKG